MKLSGLIAGLVVGLVVASLMLFGCAEPARESVDTDNSRFNVERIFTVEGCDVYRFYDAGYLHYLTLCRGSVTTQQSAGKNSTYPDEIPTQVRP